MDTKLWGCDIFGHKMDLFAETKIFSENLLINLAPIIHAYLCSKNQSQISNY